MRSHKKIPKALLCFISVSLIWWMNHISVSAADTETMQQEEVTDQILDLIDESEINEMLRELFPEEKMDLKDTVRRIMKGELPLDADLLNRIIKEQMLYAFERNGQGMKYIIILAIGSALFLNIAGIFQTKQISEISFFVLFMLLVGVCLASYEAASEWVGDGMNRLVSFFKVLYPVYFVVLTVAKGSFTSMGFYHLTLLLVVIAEVFVMKVVLPVIHIYVITRILNSMQMEDYLSKLAEFLEIVISWMLKTMVGFMIGLNVIQGLIAPTADTVKRSIVTKGVEAIPAIGDMLGGTTEIILGTAVLIKNSIGVFGAVVCCLLCLVPLLQIAFITAAYKITAAVVQPASDERIVECISAIGEGCHLLMKTVFSSGLLFLLTIAIVACTTSSV